jgi:hypothetical protein
MSTGMLVSVEKPSICYFRPVFSKVGIAWQLSLKVLCAEL